MKNQFYNINILYYIIAIKKLKICIITFYISIYMKMNIFTIISHIKKTSQSSIYNI
jgi:hypothetical protein